MVKNLPAMQETWVGKIPWRREWLPTPVFLPAEFHGQRSLVGYSPWGHRESDTTEQLTLTSLVYYVDLYKVSLAECPANLRHSPCLTELIPEANHRQIHPSATVST